MNTLLILLIAISVSAIDPGMQRAIDYLRQPLPPTRPIQDIILRGKFDYLQENAFRLNRIRSRLGKAWEFVFLDFGFVLINNRIDIINHNRQIAIELKNSWRTDNSRAKTATIAILQEFKTNNPDYTVIYGAINYKNQRPGKDVMRGGVRIMYGDVFLNFIFGARKDEVVRTLKTAYPDAPIVADP